MRAIIRLKTAAAIEVGEHVLTLQHPVGILIAHKVVTVEMIDGGKFVELATNEQRLHVVGADVVVAVIL